LPASQDRVRRPLADLSHPVEERVCNLPINLNKSEASAAVSDGSVTLKGLKVNIQVQFRDGALKELLPGPERYADESYIRRPQKELGL
jgi:hypothetical protein